METILETAVGSYTGEGVWYDSASVQHRYGIEMRIEKLPNGNIRQWFKHVFFEEAGEVIEQTIDYVFSTNGIFELPLVGTPLKGRGYCSADICHYSIPVPDNLVEVTQFFLADGVIRGVGSAEKNAQGNYIWWEEKLSRK